MKNLLLLTLITIPSFSHAQTQEVQGDCPSTPAYQLLLNAITVCPAEENPALGLSQLLGNAYTNVKFDGEGIAVATIVHDPRLLNSRVGAPMQIKGDIRIEMSYPAPGFGLVCKLTVNKFKPQI